MDICLGCMKEISADEKRCPYCGFSIDDKVLNNALVPNTLLAQKYKVGKTLAINGEGITYTGYDVDNKKAIRIREYFPQGLVERDDKTIVLNDGCHAKYKTLKSDFIELYKILLELQGLKNLTPVVDLFEENGTVYAVLECVKCKTLNSYLIKEDRCLTWEETITLLNPIFNVLIELNKKGILHRGISAKTIFVCETGELKIGGFSICSLRVNDSEIPCEVNDGYAPIEQYEKQLSHGEWTDVYAICAVIYRMLTAKQLKKASVRAELDEAVEPWKINDTVSKECSDIIMKGLSVNFEDRIKDIEKLSLDFQKLQGKNSEGIATKKIRVSDTKIFTSNTDKKAEIDDNEFKTQMFDATKIVKMADTQSNKQEQQNNDDGKSESPKKGKKKLPVWFLVLLGGIPLALCAGIYLYYIMVGFGEEEDVNYNEGVLTSVTSQSSEQTITSDVTSSEPIVEDETIEVPNFRGDNYINIVENAQYKSMFKIVPTFSYSDEQRSGLVISQDVAEGERVHEGATINLVVSQGPKNIPIPDINALSVAQLIEFLTDDYGIPTTQKTEPSDTVPIGSIIRVDGVVPGGTADRSTVTLVTIYVSSGKLPESVEDNTSSTEPESDTQSDLESNTENPSESKPESDLESETQSEPESQDTSSTDASEAE